MSGALSFVAATQMTLLNHLAMGARELAINPESHGTETIEETVLGRLPE